MKDDPSIHTQPERTSSGDSDLSAPPSDQRANAPAQPSSTPRGGLFSQLLELFGMTPNVQSGPTGVKRLDERVDPVTPPAPKPRCRACYNPASWDETEQRWRCKDHPHAEMMDIP